MGPKFRKYPREGSHQYIPHANYGDKRTGFAKKPLVSEGVPVTTEHLHRSAAAPETSPMHPKRRMCTARDIPDVGGVISQLIERLRTLWRSQSGEAWAVEGPCNVELAVGVGSASQ